MKSKMSGKFTLSRIFEIKLNLRHFTFLPTYTYRRCIVSFMPQYYFSVKLNAKKRQVKIRQTFHPRFGAKKYLLSPKTGVKSIAYF